MSNFVKTLIAGIGATVTIDIWSFLLRIFTGKSYGLIYIGRWLGYVPQGNFCHVSIVQTPPLEHEAIIGLVAHYIIGISFAFLLVKLFGATWLSRPSFLPALFIGIITLFIPILIVQPMLGFGIAFSKMPNQGVLLVKIFLIHVVYALGLYVIANILRNYNLKLYK
jgi:hypothetical protein